MLNIHQMMEYHKNCNLNILQYTHTTNQNFYYKALLKQVAKNNIQNLSRYSFKQLPPTMLITRKNHKSSINYWGNAIVNLRVLI